MLLVIDNLLSKDEVAQFRARLDKADWIDGQESAGSLSRDVKHNRQLDENSEAAIALGNQILRVLGHHPTFLSAALPEKIYPPKFNRYTGGEHYGAHIDSAIMRAVGPGFTMRADMSATVFLSEPEDYDGGILTIETAYGAQEVKLGAGDMVLYPSNSLHHVTPVTRGVRTSAFFWVHSIVADEAKRAILFDFDQVIRSLRTKDEAHRDEIMRLTAGYNNLLRLWAIV